MARLVFFFGRTPPEYTNGLPPFGWSKNGLPIHHPRNAAELMVSTTRLTLVSTLGHAPSSTSLSPPRYRHI